MLAWFQDQTPTCGDPQLLVHVHVGAALVHRCLRTADAAPADVGAVEAAECALQRTSIAVAAVAAAAVLGRMTHHCW